MVWILVTVLSIATFSLFALNRYSHRKRLNQNTYIVYLLLSDEIREGQKRNFLAFLREERPLAEDAEELTLSAFDAIEGVADKLAESGSMLSAHAMIWNFEDLDNFGKEDLTSTSD